MCCFSPVASTGSWLSRLFRGRRAGVAVSKTRIFARLDGEGEEVLAYQMRLSVGSEVAMVLPLPVAPTHRQKAVRFIDVSGHTDFFDRLDAVWNQYPSRQAGPQSKSSRWLEVERVGSYEASYVPDVASFERIDPRFRLPDGFFSALPGYHDYGFAVFRLAPGEQTVHPMALRFRTRDSGRLFFPTVHVHDGRVHRKAHFDHSLYFQSATSGTHAEAPQVPELEARFRASAPRELVAETGPLFRRRLVGRLENRDTWIDLTGGDNR